MRRHTHRKPLPSPSALAQIGAKQCAFLTRELAQDDDYTQAPVPANAPREAYQVHRMQEDTVHKVSRWFAGVIHAKKVSPATLLGYKWVMEKAKDLVQEHLNRDHEETRGFRTAREKYADINGVFHSATELFRARAYFLLMAQESLQSNVIAGRKDLREGIKLANIHIPKTTKLDNGRREWEIIIKDLAESKPTPPGMVTPHVLFAALNDIETTAREALDIRTHYLLRGPIFSEEFMNGLDWREYLINQMLVARLHSEKAADILNNNQAAFANARDHIITERLGPKVLVRGHQELSSEQLISFLGEIEALVMQVLRIEDIGNSKT